MAVTQREIGLLEAVPWLRAYAGAVFVVKVGGELLDEPRWRDAVARDVATIHRLGPKVVVVHGGGPQLDRAAAAAGLHSERVAGRRITSPELVELAIGEWRGKVSAALVGALQRQGERAVSIAGFEAGTVTARRRPPVEVVGDDGGRVTVDYGRVGDVVGTDPAALRAMLAEGFLPVVTPLAGSAEGEVLNVNADTVAADLAVALGAAKLLLVTRAPGILEDPANEAAVLAQTRFGALEALIDAGRITGGMRPKVAAIGRALSGGVARVHVVDGRRPGALLEEVFTTEGSGTLVLP